jgi:hypothetical protein
MLTETELRIKRIEALLESLGLVETERFVS